MLYENENYFSVVEAIVSIDIVYYADMYKYSAMGNIVRYTHTWYTYLFTHSLNKPHIIKTAAHHG